MDHVKKPNMKNVCILGMDEFAIQRGHQYAAVVVDLVRKEVLLVGRGRSREDIRLFFEQIRLNACKRIKTGAMDQSAAYGNELKK